MNFIFSNCFKKFYFKNVAIRCFSSDLESVLTNQDSSSKVRSVTLNDLKKRNALSSVTITKLRNAIKDDGITRAIIIKANGKVFSSGHDLKELSSFSTNMQQDTFDNFAQLMLDIRNSPVPIICQVNGLAAAAGCQLVASCDIVLCTEGSTFSTPGANVGLFCSTPGIAVSRSANLKTSAYMVLTGRPINSQQALLSGLVTNVIPESKLDEETDAILEAILCKSRSVIALGKEFFYRQLDLQLPTAYSQGSCTMLKNIQMKDCNEGIKAFIGKRPPKWTHK